MSKIKTLAFADSLRIFSFSGDAHRTGRGRQSAVPDGGGRAAASLGRAQPGPDLPTVPARPLVVPCPVALQCGTQRAESVSDRRGRHHGRRMPSRGRTRPNLDKTELSLENDNMIGIVHPRPDHYQVWDLRQRKCLQQLRGHDADVRCAIFLHQQQVTWKRLILSASADRTVRLWDVNTGSELREEDRSLI